MTDTTPTPSIGGPPSATNPPAGASTGPGTPATVVKGNETDKTPLSPPAPGQPNKPPTNSPTPPGTANPTPAPAKLPTSPNPITGAPAVPQTPIVVKPIPGQFQQPEIPKDPVVPPGSLAPTGPIVDVALRDVATDRPANDGTSDISSRPQTRPLPFGFGTKEYKAEVQREADAVSERLVELRMFISGESYDDYGRLPGAEQERIRQQETVLTAYANILDLRLRHL